jgi:threonine aldolase
MAADDIMARVTAQMRDLFEAPEASVHLVATGTAANALAWPR